MRTTFRLLGTHWFLFLIVFGGLCYAVAGGVGENLGIPTLFREDPELGRYGWTAYRNSPAFLTQAAAALLVGIQWTFVLLLEQKTRETSKILRFVLPRAATCALICLAAAIFAPFANLPAPDVGEILRMLGGAVVGLLLAVVFIHLANAVAPRVPVRPALCFLAVFLVVVVGSVTLYHKLVPAVSIALLLALVSAGYVALRLFPEPSRIWAAVSLVLLLVAGNSVPDKLTFPSINRDDGSSYYAAPVPVGGQRPRGPSCDGDEAPSGDPGSDFLVCPVNALEEWRKPFGERKPHLVLLATSGGAYRAAFWTALVLDLLEEQSAAGGTLPGFTSNIRVLTGASGGMVGAAYFAAQRDVQRTETFIARLTEDTKEAQRETRLGTQFPIPRDTLSPVAQQLAQRDVLNTFLPWRQKVDRGLVLESQWPTLNKTFAQLKQGEIDGKRPSLILSPMLVETGQPLLVSNLNLSGLSNLSRGEAVEFFRLFPEAHDTFRLATAVRMNATFPYVSPAVSLPTTPRRRVVDAGYFDNYGVHLAAAYLRQPAVRRWVQKETSGVIVVQIRAFPIETAGERRDDGLCRRHFEPERETAWDRAFQWLTSPLEGAGAAREASMVFRNNQDLNALQDLYEPGFLTTVAFENATRASMSWYLPARELECMRKELNSTHHQRQLEILKEAWNRAG